MTKSQKIRKLKAELDQILNNDCTLELVAKGFQIRAELAKMGVSTADGIKRK